MTIDNLRGLAEQRRSICGYDDEWQVSDEKFHAILVCARWAPSGGNGQPWEFIIVRDQATRYKIADHYLKQLTLNRQ
jgi:nitroreductase